MNTFSPDYNENKINNILLSLSKEISSFSNLKNPSINLKKRREFFIKELEDLTFDASRHNISIETIKLSKKLLPIEIVEGSIKVDDKISVNKSELGKILISEKYPFGLIKFKDENFDFNKKLNCGSASIKILRPEWLK